MLSFLRVLRNSLLLAVTLIACDALTTYLLASLHFAFVEIMGDLMLVQVAALFIGAGLIDFSTSIGAAQFRKMTLRSGKDFSSAKHKESDRRASVLLLAGLVMFAILVVFAALGLA
ncbi:MAG TPA: hypothetical protein VLV18_10390 [Terriglobales bacterium]|nr:hypothetical protein [Terriglobales bacterium]